MGIIKKYGYKAKAEYASSRHKLNAEIGSANGLTEEQAEIIAEIAAFRHELHCNQETLFNTGSADHNRYWDLLGDGKGNLVDRAESAGLRRPFKRLRDDEYITDQSWDDDAATEDEARQMMLTKATFINNQIEAWLGSIDAAFGTQYKPGGHTRLF